MSLVENDEIVGEQHAGNIASGSSSGSDQGKEQTMVDH
jgi:hypothetical protein